MSGVDAQFWHKRWEADSPPFHQSTPNEQLVSHFSKLQLEPGAHCLVPLCGKSLDMKWIASQGHRVTGVELSPIAVQAFFKEDELPYRTATTPSNLRNFISKSHALIEGNFFDVDPSDVPNVDWIYDRAAIVSFSPEDQRAYAKHLQRFLDVGKKILLITFEYNSEEMNGPPFSVDVSAVRQLFEPQFDITVLAHEDILSKNERFQKRGLTRLEQSVIILEKKRSRS